MTPLTDEDAEALVRAALEAGLTALRGAGSFGRTPKEQHAALEQYCMCRDAILALSPADIVTRFKEAKHDQG